MKRFLLLIAVLSWAIISADITVRQEGPSRLRIEIELAGYDLTEQGDYTFLHLPGFAGKAVPGTPDLPSRQLNIIIPPQGSIVIREQIISEETISLNKPVAPVPQILPDEKTHRYLYVIDPESYNVRSRDYYQESERDSYRYYDFIPVIITPVNYDHHNKQVTLLKKMVLDIEIIGDIGFHYPVVDKFSKSYLNFFANYQQGKFWAQARTSAIPRIPFENSAFWFRLEMDNWNTSFLSWPELSQLPAYCDPSSVRILGLVPISNAFGEEDFQLTEIPIQAELNDPVRFSPSDRLYFEIDWDSGIPGNRNYLLWLTFGGSFPDPALRRDTVADKSLAQPPLSFQSWRPELLKIRERGVNCIFIHPAEFLSQTQQLAQFHEYYFGSTGLLADQQEIFNTYSNGNASPVAIKNYLQDYWQSSEGDSLEYVILVGSGTGSWDLSNEKNRIITFSSSDDNFVAFTSNYPELIISRLPAQNVNSLSMLIDRIRSYSEDPTPGWWHNMLMIMADDENKNGALEGITGDGLNHTLLAQQTENLLNKGVFIEKILGIEYDFDEFNTKPEARDAMISAINEGRLIWYYIGHGNPDVLGDEDYFRGSQHLNYLDNSDHLPLFIAASCSVGEFDSPSFDCLAERLLFLDNGGSIASLAASRACSGQTNTDIMKIFLIQLINERESLGHAVYTAKLFYPTYLATAKLYNLLGDPLLGIVPPERIGMITGLPDSILIRQTVSITGSLSDNTTAPGEIKVYDSAYEVNYTNTLNDQTYSVDYLKNGSTLFRGDIEVNLGTYNSSFIIPDDIRPGPAGRVISYIRNEYSGTEYINFQYPVHYSSSYENAVNEDVPQVQLWLDSRKFQTGDYVSTNPLLIAEIEDDNGINILGSAGHRILALLDDDLEPVDVTSGFIYYSGSHTQGELQWQFQGLEEGWHSLMLIVFDNFNTPAVASTEFRCQGAGRVAIEQMLPYPNPMSGDGYFTFVLTEDADIIIDIFTMTGRKIRTIRQDACEAGYNQIYWDGRDGDGDRLANNTYFYKIRAKQASDHRSVEKTGKVIIFK